MVSIILKYFQSKIEFKNDVYKTKNLLEDLLIVSRFFYYKGLIMGIEILIELGLQVFSQ